MSSPFFTGLVDQGSRIVPPSGIYDVADGKNQHGGFLDAPKRILYIRIIER
jgi:hypothetical protein